MTYNGGNSSRWKNGNNTPKNDNYKKAQLPEGYLEGGYFEEQNGKQILKKAYIIDYSREIARALGDKREWDKPNSDQNRRSQIRKYYEYILRVQGILQRTGGGFSEVESELNRLIPFVYYARSRETISELFKVFIEKNIAQIHETKELNAFIKHFEAIVAYLPRE